MRTVSAGGLVALINGAAAAAQGGSIADIAQAASDGFLWGAIGEAIAGGMAVMFNQAVTTGSSLAGNYAVRQAVDVGTDTVLDTVQAVARGEDVNTKTIGRDLLRNTLMAGAQVAGGSGKNGIAREEIPNRNTALNQAKRDAKVPRSQNPSRIDKVDMTEPAYVGGHKIQDSTGKVVKTREYQYTTYSGDSIVIQEHSYPHIGSEEAHFNVRPKEDTRNGKVPGTKEHYPFKK